MLWGQVDRVDKQWSSLFKNISRIQEWIIASAAFLGRQTGCRFAEFILDGYFGCRVMKINVGAVENDVKWNLLEAFHKQFFEKFSNFRNILFVLTFDFSGVTHSHSQCSKNFYYVCRFQQESAR